jgi:hypothetical protein
VFSPFAGVGSELEGAIRLGRKAVGIELKESYFRFAAGHLTQIEKEMDAPKLDFDGQNAADLTASLGTIAPEPAQPPSKPKRTRKAKASA